MSRPPHIVDFDAWRDAGSCLRSAGKLVGVLLLVGLVVRWGLRFAGVE